MIEILIVNMRPLDKRYTQNASLSNLSKWVRDNKDNFETTVELWRPWNPFTSALASTYSNNWEIIKLNKRKLNRSISSITASIGHEWGHCFEYFLTQGSSEIQFNHGDNSPVGKEDTFQYQLGRSIKRHVQDNLDEILQNIGLA